MTTIFSASRRRDAFQIPIKMYFPVVGDVGLSQPIENSAEGITGALEDTAKLGPNRDFPLGFLTEFVLPGYQQGSVLVEHADNSTFAFDTKGNAFVQPVTPIARSVSTFFDVDSGEIPGVTCGTDPKVYCCASYGPGGVVAAENSTTPCSTLLRDATFGLVFRRIIISLVPVSK